MSHPKNDNGYESLHLNPSNHAFISKLTFFPKMTFFKGGGGGGGGLKHQQKKK
jgi:hypothetical protein